MRWLYPLVIALGLGGTVGSGGCGGDDAPGKTAYFELAGPIDMPQTFWDFPFPSDVRLAASGAPDLTGFPNPRSVPILNALLSVANDRRGWPMMPVVYVRFTQPVPEHVITDVIAPGDPSVTLVDIDAASPELGTAYPLVAATLPVDPYVPSDLVAFAPRPGIVLRGHTQYALVVRSAFAPGFEPAPAFARLAEGKAPSTPRGAAALAQYQPLRDALDANGIPFDDVLVATVFTTGDEVARAKDRSDHLRTTYHPTIDNLALFGGATHDGFCELRGTITMPQFQKGTQPFDIDGRFVVDANDVPAKQSDLTIPLRITLPKAAMPAAGWPLYQFFHGSGGVSSGLVDLGHSPTPADEPEPGKGPGYVAALHGIAAAAAALPVNPERFPGASDYSYLNINNLSAFPYTFQQGVIEQRLLLDALLALQIPQSVVAGCGLPAPTGGAAHHFDPAQLMAGGQSMGGMYTNMIGAVEPRFGALVPTGAGGFWNLMILETAIIPGARALLGTALGVDDSTLLFVHPGLDAMALGWEIAEPMVYMARLARRPLAGSTARHVYEPVGKGDSYFPIDIYDAAALAYGNQQVGPEIWPSMQHALATDQLAGLATYPVKGNRSGKTRVVVQYNGDGIVDPHYLYRQLDEVKHQYGCFLESYVRDGIPTVPAPGPLADPCP
ncbi:MAG: hypothetical protein IPQ07_19095 [Myxococcales bacterium]|nr:hypothetical protein [Myxococcales bacterium]